MKRSNTFDKMPAYYIHDQVTPSNRAPPP